ncbi:MAG: hypothetical protein Q8Q85_06215, partial [Gemmatimonadales bacterium]|nr:hypothetical protein [Gemmatimonadales bacterium]
RDSGFVLGWVGLARAFERARTWQFPVPGVPRDSVLARLVAAAERANELDSTNAEVWIMRARVSEALDPTSRGPGIRYLRRALAIDSMDADAWQILGLSLEESFDRAGALAALNRAVAVQPGHTEALTFLALHYFWARQYDTAAVWADSVVAVDPTLVVARYAAGTVAIERGRRSEAEAQLQACNRLATSADVQCLTGLARLAARTGDPAAARDYLAQALARTDSISPSVHGAVYLACAYATLGDPDRALSWLTRYSPRRDMHFQMHMRYEPALDALRSDPRLQALRTETR